MCPKINNSKDLLITYGTTKSLLVDVMHFDIYVSYNYSTSLMFFFHFETAGMNNWHGI